LGLLQHYLLFKQRRRPTQDELDRLIATFESHPRQQIPLGSILRFAVAIAMRQDEISRIAWGTSRTHQRKA
jgi:hypothetical protein